MMVLKESEPNELCLRSSKDIMLGVSTAQLSKELPTYLQILLCDMATGYKVYCLGSLEAKSNKSGNVNQRDIQCIGLKLVLQPPQENGWTCWPCLDFLKKFDCNLWMQRKRMEFFQNLPLEQHCTKKPSSWNTRKQTAPDRKKEQNSLEGYNDAIVINGVGVKLIHSSF